MDSHVHVSSIPGMGFGVEPVAQKNDALAEEYYRQQPYSFLYYGITQVVDPIAYTYAVWYGPAWQGAVRYADMSQRCSVAIVGM